MRLLLDTHVLLWAATDPDRLGAAASVLQDPEHELHLSAASAWEIAIKHSTGRLALPAEPATWFADAVRSLAAVHVPVDWQDAVAVTRLPPLHRDPFDRLLVAQAERRGQVLVTADPLVVAYGTEVLDLR